MSSPNAISSLSNAIGGAGADSDPMHLAACAAAASAAPSQIDVLEARLAALKREAKIAELEAQLATIKGGGASAPPAASSAVGLVIPTKGVAAPPINLTLMLDISGSMGIAAGEGEQKVFSRLDLARRAALLAAYMMREGDTLTIITFSTDAEIFLPPTPMTAANKERVKTLLTSLGPGGSTNLSAGLRKAFTIPDAHILILTDGEADAGQTVGVLSEVIRTANYRGTLSTVGFTYASKSDILSTLAALGRGSFGFVSSSDMLMTVILNWISRHLANEPIQAPSAAVGAYIAVLKAAYGHAMRGDYRAARDAIEAFRVTLPAGSIFLKDIEGEVGLAMSGEEPFRKWGCHHFLALISSHEQQHCGNFKDPSVQPYITPRFKAIQEEGVRVFEALPPLVGSHAVSAAHAAATALSGYAASAVYLNPYGGCFGKDAYVTRKLPGEAAWEVVSFEELQPGDEILSGSGHAVVHKIIEYHVPFGSMEMTLVNKAFHITPWHPLLYGGIWSSPAKIGEFSTHVIPMEKVYNLLLVDTHTVLVRGKEVAGPMICCTLAHGLTGPVIEHPYFGTDAVVKDLMAHPTWQTDRVIYTNPEWIVDPKTGLVNATVDNGLKN